MALQSSQKTGLPKGGQALQVCASWDFMPSHTDYYNGGLWTDTVGMHILTIRRGEAPISNLPAIFCIAMVRCIGYVDSIFILMLVLIEWKLYFSSLSFTSYGLFRPTTLIEVSLIEGRGELQFH